MNPTCPKPLPKETFLTCKATAGKKKKKKKKGEGGGGGGGFWYLAQSAIRPTTHTCTPWSQDLFIYKPSQLPREHTTRLPFQAHETIQTHKLSLSYQVPSYSWVERMHAWAKCLAYIGAQRLSIIQLSQLSNPRSLACKSRTLPLSHDAPLVAGMKHARACPHASGSCPLYLACSEIPASLGWGRKVPSYHAVPRWSTARVFSMNSRRSVAQFAPLPPSFLPSV